MSACNELATGDDMLLALAALANPHRLRLVAALRAQGRAYVSQLAREIGLSRPLLHLHLKKLESAGLVVGELELSADGKALRYYALRDFSIVLNPSTVAKAAATITPERTSA